MIYFLVHDNFKHPLCKPETEGYPRNTVEHPYMFFVFEEKPVELGCHNGRCRTPGWELPKNYGIDNWDMRQVPVWKILNALNIQHGRGYAKDGYHEVSCMGAMLVVESNDDLETVKFVEFIYSTRSEMTYEELLKSRPNLRAPGRRKPRDHAVQKR